MTALNNKKLQLSPNDIHITIISTIVINHEVIQEKIAGKPPFDTSNNAVDREPKMGHGACYMKYSPAPHTVGVKNKPI